MEDESAKKSSLRLFKNIHFLWSCAVCCLYAICTVMGVWFLSPHANSVKTPVTIPRLAKFSPLPKMEGLSKKRSLDHIKISPVPFNGKKAERVYHSIIEETSERFEMDPALIKAVIMAESGYDPKAVSKRGAMGLMQLMPRTAESLGVNNIFDAKENIRGGVRYLKKLIRQCQGDVRLALAAYNAGLAKVRFYRGIPPYKATEYYICKVLHYYRYYKQKQGENIEEV